MSSIQESAFFVQKLAAQNGASESSVNCTTNREVNLSWREEKLERVSEATTHRLQLLLYTDGRYSDFSTSDLRPEALRTFVTNASSLVRVLAKDPFRGLPSPELYANRASINLELEDSSAAGISVEEMKEKLARIEQAARKGPGKKAIVAATASGTMITTQSFQIQSNGFEGMQRSSYFEMQVEVSANDAGGKKPSESDYSANRFFSDLASPEHIGNECAKRTLQKIGSKKFPSGKFTVAVENRAAGSLFSRLLDPLRARALQQKSSCLEGKLGKRIASAHLDLVDNPLLRRGLGSRLFDGEGITAKPFSVVEAGVLRNFYIGNYYGRKLAMQPTTASPSNLSWKLGTKSRDQLVNDIGNGYLITNFLGGNSNSTTGDFSLGVSGLVIKNGKAEHSFSEMNLSGNHLQFWNQLVAVGNDPYPYSWNRAPTLVFDQTQLAGS